MAERGRTEGFGGRGPRRGGGRRRNRGPEKEDSEWVPVTKLGRLVAAKKIERLEEIFVHSLPIKEQEIIDRFLDEKVLLNEVMKVKSVQKQTRAGQRTRFKAFVAVGDQEGHVGLGWKHSKEV
jgi:small subunit ribosomal protein S2e